MTADANAINKQTQTHKYMNTIFRTANSMLKYFPTSYGSLESDIREFESGIKLAKNRILGLCAATPKDIAGKDCEERSLDPLHYVGYEFDEMLELYNDDIYRYCDCLVTKADYEKSDDKEHYFKGMLDDEYVVRNVVIEGHAVTCEEDRQKLFDESVKKTEEIETLLRAMASASPNAITPDGEEPIAYVTDKVSEWFDRLLELNTLCTKLSLMDDEIRYPLGDWSEGLDDEAKAERFWKENAIVG